MFVYIVYLQGQEELLVEKVFSDEQKACDYVAEKQKEEENKRPWNRIWTDAQIERWEVSE